MRLGLLLPLAGCFPYVLPPAEANVGAGPATNSVRSEGEEKSAKEVGAFHVRGLVHPLALSPRAHSRPVDAGLGYQYERADPAGDASGLHGPVMTLDGYFLRPKSHSGAARIGLRGSAEILLADINGQAETGTGGGIALLAQYTGFSVGDYESTDDEDGSWTAGVHAGEWAIGGYLGVSHRSIGEQSYWTGGIGISVQWPLLVGVACCAWPSSDDGDEDDSYEYEQEDEGPRRVDPSPGVPYPARRSDPPERTPAHPSPGRTPADPEPNRR